MSYQFEAPIEKRDYGKYFYHAIFLPAELDEKLPRPRFRSKGTIDGVPFSGAFQPGAGRRYVIVSKKLLKQGNFSLDQEVSVEFELLDDSHVEIPEALQLALDSDSEMALLWGDLTPGKQRGLCHRVASAKRAETIQRRVEEVLEEIRW